MTFEPVYTVTDFHDGPRRGVASFEGSPHVYESEWDDEGDDYAHTFLVSPISDDDLRLALEDWAIWLRWSAAFNAGTTTIDTHPALPADRERHLELNSLLRQRLVIADDAVKVTAIFRASEVCWQRV